jgi:nitroreductase
MKPIIEALNWRYATQVFDTSKKLTDEQVNTLLDAARLSPSWYGLQPWKFILVENPEIRAKLREVSYGQPKVTEASHLIVFAHKTTLDEAYVDTYIKSTAGTRGITPENLSGLKEGIMGLVRMIGGAPSPWAANQTHIALGVLIGAASTMEIDTAPYGGFDPEKYDEILGLKELGLHAVVACALGYRLDSDEAATRKKSRFSLEEVVIRQ